MHCPKGGAPRQQPRHSSGPELSKPTHSPPRRFGEPGKLCTLGRVPHQGRGIAPGELARAQYPVAWRPPLLANNLYRVADTSADDVRVSRLAKLLVPGISADRRRLYVAWWANNRGAAPDGLQPGDAAFSSPGSLPCASQHCHGEGAVAGILAGVATVVVVGSTGVTMKTLFPWLPAAVRDINVGIIVLAVNFVVLILVSLATGPRQREPRQSLAARNICSIECNRIFRD
jgi:hypothetical protein